MSELPLFSLTGMCGYIFPKWENNLWISDLKKRTPSVKQKGPFAVFVSQEKDKRAYRLYRLTTRNTSYLYLIIGKKMQPVQSIKCQLSYVLQILPPLTPRKDNTEETIAICV